ncbi:uncharacterized protein LOC130962545 [Arachis stenosperma]|uniref:uncharacterized protein LOC130962545 n=1 Tax=Arachis stenosperma TaxID=217475 RepID=UPI0025AC7963|nr:uncharacterized protein LOC130962545 [Arachis stenosperma]
MANPIPLPDFLQQRAFDFAVEKLTNVWKKHVRNRVDYTLNCHKKLKKLGNAVDELKEDGKKVHDKAEEDERLYGREVYHVKAWLRQVDEIISEYGKLKDEHSNHVVINLKKRYLYSKRAEEIKELVMELQKEKLDNISYWQQQQQQQQQWSFSGFMGVTFSGSDYMEFKSRRTTMKKIMASLEDSNSRLVGVYGPAGIGKTTLVIKAAKQAQEDKLFDMVIMVNVTKRPDTKKIQGQIAEMLGMKLEDESEEARATSIQERLKNEKDNILIILDDLYAKLDLNALGIPLQTKEESSAIVVHNQNPESEDKQTEEPDTADAKMMKAKNSFVDGSSKLKDHNRGYKILLISELRQVLTEMDVKAASIFSINFLNSNEAETLFKKTAAIFDKNVDELKKYSPDQIAEKCNGLPMLIVTTARALKNQKNHLVWKDTLGKLAKLAAENPNAAPEYSTRLSYGLLENEELKLTFLLCARMDHNALVADLVKYCIGLGFLQGVYSVWEVRDKVQMLLAKLKDAGLLSNSYSRNRFTMQNLVRDAALSISSEERHVFTMTEGKFDEWPSKDELERCTVISLKHCDFIRGFPNSLKCPSLSVFHIENNDPSLEIPDSFFQEMKELRVLILIGVNLSSLPSSIKCLTNLRMLCLEQCILGEKLELIGELKNLRILSFSGSDIRILPDKLSHLSKLQIFDISNCYKLRIVPYCVMSSLTRLEELYMRNIPFQWEVDDGKQKHQSENASLSVLGDLDQLTNLDLQIPSVSYLPKNLFFDKLYSYKITIGSSIRYSKPYFQSPNKYDLSRCLVIYQKDGFDIHSHEAIKILFERVEILLLEKLNSVKDVFYELNLQGFSYLKHLTIARNCSIQCLIGPKRRENYLENAFPKLESLHLYKLRKMEQICSHQSFTEPSFSKLKTIKIELCGMLKNVFLSSVVGFLTALETIEVSECNSLKEIVVMETNNSNETEPILNLPKLRSLTLQSLSKLIGFYPISSEGDTKSLFHRKIEVPKLERIELCMLEINHIWSDQIWTTCHTVDQSKSPLQKLKELGKKYHTIKQTYSPFQNLIHLDVNGCWNLKCLWSFSIARHLVNLQSLFVTDCNMTHIFPQHQGGGEAKTKKDGIFPNLKTVKLSSIKSLCKIWNSDEAPENSYGKLNTLIIDKCDELVNVIPHNMARRLASLSCLRVTNCASIKVIFEEADDDDKRQDAMHNIKLQDIHLEALPKLENVFKWKKEVNWSDLKLQKIWVHRCGRLENIFSVSVVKNVEIKIESLESFVVSDCYQLREIVGKGKDAVINSSSPIQFEFPKLTTVKFSGLSKFKSFYSSGAYELSCPTLKDLSIKSCDLLELFEETSSHAEIKNVLFPENSKTGEVKVKEEINNKLKSMHIDSRHLVGSSMDYDYRRDSLEELQLSRLNNSNIIYSFLHCNPNLKSLHLDDCDFEELKPGGTRRPAIGVVPKLKSLTLTNMSYLWKICFEQDAVLQKIESLVVNNCSSLHTIAPSSVSLAHLTILELVGCWNLKYVMSPSTAKSLGQLKTMKVINCKNLEEIVTEKTQGQEEKENVVTDVSIIFKQLITLELVSLVRLNSFCSSKNVAFKFPSFENFIVSACPKMEVFSANEVDCGPNLQKIYYVHDKEKKRWCWHEDNIGSTIRHIFENKKFFEGMNKLDLDFDKDLLKPIWRSKEGPRKDWFSGLKTLTLCDWDTSNTHAIPSNVLCCLKSLQELQVLECKSIESIFEMDDTKSWELSFQLKKLTLYHLPSLKSVWQYDKGEILLGFQNLQQVTIYGCSKLTSVFPTVLARDLKKLQELHVSYCAELQEIVGKDVGGSETFKFPRLTTLILSNLPQLSDFKSGRLSLECPELKQLKLYPKQQQKYPEGGFSKVEKLYLNELYSYSGYNDDEENSTSPFEIFADDKMLPKLETIHIHGNKHCKTINVPKEAGERMLHLKELKLESLHELSSISGIGYLLKLRLLEVSRCPKWTRVLVLHSYSNLKELHIFSCHGLECLLTSSAAKMLIHLEELKVEYCNSLKEIVGKEEESGTEDIIEFKRLHRITLNHLGRLECFYSGNATLQFPSLIRLDILRCSKMKIFSQTEINVKPPLFQVFYSSYEAERLFLHNLNVAVVCQFLQQKHLVLGNHRELKDLWLGKVHIPAKSYSSSFNLERLVVEGCDEFFTTAILPSHLLPFLRRLQVLEVRGCNSVEAIFEVKNTPADIVIPLKKLTLEKLPTLSHIWNKNPKRSSLSFPCLKEVVVNGCKSLTSLLPASLAMSNMKKIDVKNCEELVEIVTKDEADNEEINKELIMFPKLTSLTLHNLPNLTYIYAGMQILNLPKLRELDISQCKFAIDSTVEVVTPHLKRLSIDKAGVMMLDNELLHLDPQNIKYLTLQGFNDIHDSDAASVFDFFPKVPLSNLLMLGVADSAFKEIFPSQKPEIIHSQSQLLISKLRLWNLHKLESNGLQHTWVASSNLTWLKVEGCASLKYLFTSSAAKCLVQLEELYISNCEALESLMVDYQPHDDDHDVIIFEKLKKLSLSQIPKLESFYKGKSTLNFPSLKEVEVTECNRLEYLFTFSTAKNLQHLFKMEISKCESLETVVLATQKGDKSQEDLTFSDFTYLTLSELPKLESLFTENSSTLNFPSLKKVEVTKCNRLEYMFTFSTAKSFKSLKQMKISKCESLKTVVLAEADEPRELTFSYLWNLSLSESPKLGSFFTGKSTLKFQAYLYIEISQCKIMKTFSHGDVEAPKLNIVKIDGVSCSKDNLNAAVSQQFEKRSTQH